MNADRYRIYNDTRQCLVATDAETADGTTGSADARLFELTPGSGAALWISPFRDISPACAHIPLDLVYVNGDGVVLDTVEFFPMNGPGIQSEKAASVIALPADTVAKGGTRPGDRLQISAAEKTKEQSREQQNGDEQGNQLTHFSPAEPGGQLVLFPTAEPEPFFELEQVAPMWGTAEADAMPGAGISTSSSVKIRPVLARYDAVRAGTLENEQPAMSPTGNREGPTGEATAEVAGGTAIAPPIDPSESTLLQLMQLGGSVFSTETVRPVGPSAIAGCEERTVRFESANETHLHLATAAQSIPRSGAGTNRHPDTTRAERTSGTDGRADSSREALSNSHIVEMPRRKMPGGKPNAEQVWGKRGVGPKSWIERMLLNDTPVRRSIQSLLLNDTATKNWILSVLLGEKPNGNWVEDMLSTEVLDPRRAPREKVPGLIAYFFTGGPSVQHPIRNISASGLYMVTKVRWYEGTIVQLTLTDEDKPTDEGSITVQGKVVRTGDDGVGFEMLLEGSPAHDGRYERHVPTNGVGVTHLEGLMRMIKSKHVREEQVVETRVNAAAIRSL